MKRLIGLALKVGTLSLSFDTLRDTTISTFAQTIGEKKVPVIIVKKYVTTFDL